MDRGDQLKRRQQLIDAFAEMEADAQLVRLSVTIEAVFFNDIKSKVKGNIAIIPEPDMVLSDVGDVAMTLSGGVVKALLNDVYEQSENNKEDDGETDVPGEAS